MTLIQDVFTFDPHTKFGVHMSNGLVMKALNDRHGREYTLDNNCIHCLPAASSLRHAKRSPMSWVIVIPKEGLAHIRYKKNIKIVVIHVWQRLRTLETFSRSAAHVRTIILNLTSPWMFWAASTDSLMHMVLESCTSTDEESLTRKSLAPQLLSLQSPIQPQCVMSASKA